MGAEDTPEEIVDKPEVSEPTHTHDECEGCKALKGTVAELSDKVTALAPVAPIVEPLEPDTKPHDVPWTHRQFGGH